jgi:arginine decarboxylase
VLVFNVLGVSAFGVEQIPTAVNAEWEQPVNDLIETYNHITARNALEAFHDAQAALDTALSLFGAGYLPLEQRSTAENIFWAILTRLRRLTQTMDDVPEDLQNLDEALSDTYFCNFSLFQSIPDSWAIKQLFPIMPIHRLDEAPTRRGTLQDVTCDSDGKIDRFVGGREGQASLELHPWREDEPYILGIFLTGAYQEILGDLHNLFGDTNAVHVRAREGGYDITDLVHGDTVTEVLTYVQFHASDLLATFRRKVSAARGLSRQDANAFIADYVAGLEGYTYLEGES